MEQNGQRERVRVTVSLTPDDIFRAEKTFFSKRKKAQQRRIVFIILLMLFPFATYLFVWWYMRIMRAGGWIDLEPDQIELVTTMLVLGAVSVTVAGIAYLAVRRRKLKTHVRRGLQYRASLCTYTFDDKISIVTPSQESVLNYAEITEIIEDYYGYLIVPQTGALVYIPTRVLYGEELRTVKALIREKRIQAKKIAERERKEVIA